MNIEANKLIPLLKAYSALPPVARRVFLLLVTSDCYARGDAQRLAYILGCNKAVARRAVLLIKRNDILKLAITWR
jgi:hypothetical protein